MSEQEQAAAPENTAQEKTAIQMKNAPRGAIYICPSNKLIRYRDIARSRSVLRPDLTMIPADGLDSPSRLRGIHYEIVVDHAADLTEKQQAVINEYERLRDARR